MSKRKYRYPTTAEIVDYLYREKGLRASLISLQNKIMEKEHPDELIAWCDDGDVWDEACDIKNAYDDKKFVSVSPHDVPALLRQEDCSNVIELVDYHFYHHHEILDIQPDPAYPAGGRHCLTYMMTRHMTRLEHIKADLKKRLKNEADKE